MRRLGVHTTQHTACMVACVHSTLRLRHCIAARTLIAGVAAFCLAVCAAVSVIQRDGGLLWARWPAAAPNVGAAAAAPAVPVVVCLRRASAAASSSSWRRRGVFIGAGSVLFCVWCRLLRTTCALLVVFVSGLFCVSWRFSPAGVVRMSISQASMHGL